MANAVDAGRVPASTIVAVSENPKINGRSPAAANPTDREARRAPIAAVDAMITSPQQYDQEARCRHVDTDHLAEATEHERKTGGAVVTPVVT